MTNVSYCVKEMVFDFSIYLSGVAFIFFTHENDNMHTLNEKYGKNHKENPVLRNFWRLQECLRVMQVGHSLKAD